MVRSFNKRRNIDPKIFDCMTDHRANTTLRFVMIAESTFLSCLLKRILPILSAVDPDSCDLRLWKTTRSAHETILSRLSRRGKAMRTRPSFGGVKALQHRIPSRGVFLYNQYAYPWFMPETPHLNVATTFIGLYVNLRNLCSLSVTIYSPHASHRFHLMHTTSIRIQIRRVYLQATYTITYCCRHDVTPRLREGQCRRCIFRCEKVCKKKK